MITLNYAAMTDIGQQRANNEDRVWAQSFTTSEGDALGLFIVCDGLGGYLGGEAASHWAIEAVKKELIPLFTPKDPRATRQIPIEEIESALKGIPSPTKPGRGELDKSIIQAINQANAVVLQYAAHKVDRARDAGTTITLALLWGQTAVIANVGDSRTYLLRGNTLRQITRDHSLVATLVASGQIKPQDVYTHPQRNVIFRSLGHKQKITIDLFHETLKPNDQLLLCSDGLWEMLPDENRIIQLMKEHTDPNEACRQLIQAANQAGGVDNISVIIVKLERINTQGVQT